MSGKVLKPGEVRDFYLGVGEQIPAEVLEHPEFVRRCNRRRSFLGDILREAFAKHLAELPLDDSLALWQRVYWEICGVEPRLQDICLPEDPSGFGWPIVATPEVTLNQLCQGLREKFTCWSAYGDDPEAALDWERQQRSYRDGAYCVRVRDRVEADEELKNLSANQLEERGGQYITLDERVRLEGFYWILSSGQHLDMHNVTLCSGSRVRGGLVPSVYRDSIRRKLYVDRYHPGNAYAYLRARQVVSLAACGQ